MTARSHRLSALPSLPIGGAGFAAAALIGLLLARDPVIGIGALLALCLLPLALLNVPLAVSSWLVLVFFSRLPGFEAAPNRVLLLVAACCGGLLASRRLSGRPALRAGRYLLGLVGAFVLWEGLSLLWAPMPSVGLPLMKDFLYSGLAFVVVLIAVTEPRHVRWLALAFVAGATLSVLYGAAAGGLDPSGAATATSDLGGRFQGGSGDPNYLAAVIVPAIMLCGGLAVRSGPLMRLGLIVSVAILGVGLAATQSRGGLLAAAVASLAALVVWRGRRWLIASLVALLTVAVAAWFIASPTAWDRIQQVGDKGSGSGRTDIWQVAWRAGAEHPLLGVGVSQFPVVSPRYTREPGALEYVDLIVGKQIVVHNLYLELWVETGLPGLLLFLGIGGAALAAAWRAARLFDVVGDERAASLARAALLALIGMLTASFFLSNVSDRRLWVLLALGPALAVIAERQARGSAASTP